QTVHELRVGQAVLARGGVDPRDPQAAEVTLAVAPIAIPVLVCLEDRLLCGPVMPARVAAVTLRELQRRATLLAGVDRTLDASHERFAPNRTFTRASSCLVTTDGV